MAHALSSAARIAQLLWTPSPDPSGLRGVILISVMSRPDYLAAVSPAGLVMEKFDEFLWAWRKVSLA
jgi:hypothetical protein